MPRKVRRPAMPKKPVAVYPAADEIPDVCEVCGQQIDKNSSASIAHHSTRRHMPFAGKKARKAWR